MSFKVISASIFFFSISIYAQTIYVTADRIKTLETQSTSKITIIDEQQIKSSNSSNLADVLSQNSNLDIVKTGLNGNSTSVFLRGTDASHTLVILDGIVLNDPSNPNRQFDLAKLNVSNIEKIEIINGPQSILYGSNAIGGAIVITSKNSLNPNEVTLNIDSNKTISTAISGSHKLNNYQTNWGINSIISEGFSSSHDPNRSINDEDGISSYAMNFNINSPVSSDYRYGFSTRFQKENIDLDKGGGPGTDDHNYKSNTQEIFSRVNFEKFWNDTFSSNFNYGYVNQFRKSTDGNDSYQTYSDRSSYRGISHQFSAENNITFNENLNFELLVGTTKEEAEQKDLTNSFLAIYSKYSFNQNTINFGARVDYFETFHEHLTYKIGFSKDLDIIQLRTSFSTGFKAPSINQLYSSSSGNVNLKPEKSRSIDASIDYNFAIHQLTLMSFYNHIEDRMSYDASRNYLNINAGSAMTKGIELGFKTFINSFLTDSIKYNLTEAIDLRTNKRLARRAENHINHRLSYSNDKTKVDFENIFKSGRADINNSNKNVQLKKYAIANLYFNYAYLDSLTLNASIKNLFKSGYQEVWGYNNGGRVFALGMNYKF